ncbi:energy transducer TonB, partial [Pseudomonas sp.]
MKATDPTPSLPPAGASPADRLGFTLFLAAVLHIAVILGVGFTVVEPETLSKTLEITLSTFKSETKPKEADFLAQDNQQGSGTLEHKAAPKTTEKAPFQDTKVNKVQPKTVAKPPPAPKEAPKAAVATVKPQPQKTPVKREKPKPAPSHEPAPSFDREQLSSEIASLEADLANEVQAYAKRPKILRLNAASTMRDKGAWYKDQWR